MGWLASTARANSRTFSRASRYGSAGGGTPPPRSGMTRPPAGAKPPRGRGGGAPTSLATTVVVVRMPTVGATIVLVARTFFQQTRESIDESVDVIEGGTGTEARPEAIATSGKSRDKRVRTEPARTHGYAVFGAERGGEQAHRAL